MYDGGKIDVLLTKDGIYDHLLYLLLEEKSIVSHYFIGKLIVYDMIQHQEIPVLQYDEQLTTPTRNLENTSDLSLKTCGRIMHLWKKDLKKQVVNIAMRLIHID
jgi:hypothetical protein